MAKKKPFNWALLAKMIMPTVLCGVPAYFVWKYLIPKEGDMFKQFGPNADNSLEALDRRQREYWEFSQKLREFSKSDKNIWLVMKEHEEKEKKSRAKEIRRQKKADKVRMEEIRKEAGVGQPT